MNLFQLLFKQMRQRALGTTLTMLSVVLGVGLAIAIMLLYHAGYTVFGQSDYGADVLVGVRGSPLQLTMNTIYQIDVSPGNIPYSDYLDLNVNKLDSLERRTVSKIALEEIHDRVPVSVPPDPRRVDGDVKIAVPYVVGDSYKGVYRIVGTLPKLFGYEDDDCTKPIANPEDVMEYRPGMRYKIAEGRCFAADKRECIIGSEIAKKTGLKIGDQFQATHGFPKPGEIPDIHPVWWKIVGILAPTHTASDRVLFIGFYSFYTIAEHGTGLAAQYYIRNHIPVPELKEDAKHYTEDPDGTLHLDIDPRMWAVSAILVKSRGFNAGNDLSYFINHEGIDPDSMAVNPASVMREFFSTFFEGTERLLLIIALLVTIVAAMGILVSIYNSVAARMREIAILRALGATRRRVLILICAEAAFIGLIGGVLGLILGHALGAVGSYVLTQTIGQGFDWRFIFTSISQNGLLRARGWDELIYLAIVVGISLLAGLAPALKAYSVPVATNLVVT